MAGGRVGSGVSRSLMRDPSPGGGPCGRAGRGRVTGGSRAPRPGGVSRPRAATLSAGRGGRGGGRRRSYRRGIRVRIRVGIRVGVRSHRRGSHGVVRAGAAGATAARAAGGRGAGRPPLPPGPRLLPAPAGGPAHPAGAQVGAAWGGVRGCPSPGASRPLPPGGPCRLLGVPGTRTPSLP